MNIRPAHSLRRTAAFTMVEIAICLAIIGLALVAIIGVLPIGMNVQRDNREETVINQDATVFLESIRNGVQGGTDLTNYVFAITNYWVLYSFSGGVWVTNNMGVNGYSSGGSSYSGSPAMYDPSTQSVPLTNNANIIGLLSTPEFVSGTKTNYAQPVANSLYVAAHSGFISNHFLAYVRAISGPGVEKPPQDNPILIQDSFTYRILAVNAPVAIDTNLFNAGGSPGAYNDQLAANLHELRLTFAWPIRPNGLLSPDAPLPQTQRATIAGAFAVTNAYAGHPLFFYQPQSFTNAP